jgi:hypothetical protein
MSIEASRRSVRAWSQPRLGAWVASVACLALPLSAGATSFSTSAVSNDATGVVVTDSGQFSSAVTIDQDNFARSFVDPITARLGAAASNSGPSVVFGDQFESFSRSSFDDNWGSCIDFAVVPVPCNRPGFDIMLSFGFKLDGVLTNFHAVGNPPGIGSGTPLIDILARYSLGTFGSFEFHLEQNTFDASAGPLGAGSSVSAEFCAGAGGVVCSNLPVSVVAFTDAGGNDLFRFSLDVQGLQVLCVDCGGQGWFDDTSIRVQVVGDPNVVMIDALNTFQVTVASLDPNFGFVSAAGRTTVPEPATLGLLGLGLLLGAGRKCWRQRPRASQG